MKTNTSLPVNRFAFTSSSFHLFIANRLALATSFLLLFITSFLVSSSLHSQIPSYVPTNGLVGYWPFNGNANDESGNGNHGTVNGATLAADRFGNSNSSYYFANLFPTYILLPEIDQNIGQESSVFSASLWFYLTENITSANDAVMISASSESSNIIFSRSGVVNGNRIKQYLRNNNTNNEPSTNNSLDIGIWNHIIVIIDQISGAQSTYLNGTFINELFFNFNASETYFESTRRWEIGAISQAASYHQFIGQIDDVAIYNRALTQEEISALYNGTTNTSIAGCTNSTACNYNASATQDDGSCTFPAQTYLNCAGTCINDADNDGTCDELENPTLPSYLPSNGLVGYWPFNGNANDESGNGNHGTVNGATLTSDRNGNANSAYSFDGSINSIYFNNTSDVANFGTGDFSILQWFKSTSALSGHFCNSLYKFGGDNFYYDITPRSINSGLPQFHFGSNGDWNAIGNSSIDNGDWFLLCGVRNANTIQFYINGTLQSTTEIPINASANNTGNLGVFPNPCSASTPIEVYIDDIAIYNRALTQEEITALYNGTTSGGGGGNGGTAGTPAPSVPQGIPYQAMIRDNNGAALVNTPVTVRFSLRQDAIDGTVEYQETHNLTTNAFGLVNTHFGSGTATQGTFANINWSNTTKFIQVEANSGAGFVDMGTQQMMSVPFALKANSANEANKVKNAGLPVYANNAAALAGGLVAGDMYRTATGDLKIVY